MILVIGGHSRNVGKTSVVADVIRALPDRRWTAIKITQFGHGVCSSSGADCECATDPDHPFALTRETSLDSGTDTARYLAAGARESLWLRTRAGELGFAVPALKRVIARSANVIIESNSVLQFLKPDLFLAVLRPDVADFKDSSRLYLDRADAFLWSGDAPREHPVWPAVTRRWASRKPGFRLADSYCVTPDIIGFIESFPGPKNRNSPIATDLAVS